MSNTKNISVAVCGPNLNDQSKGIFHVHAEGCADLKRGVRREPEYRRPLTFEVESVEDIVDVVYPSDCFDRGDEELDAYMADFHIFPCCDDLKERN